MRPNIDISHTLHGRVKDFAEQNDLTITEAYMELLEEGLGSVESTDRS